MFNSPPVLGTAIIQTKWYQLFHYQTPLHCLLLLDKGDVNSESYYLTLFQYMSSGKSILDLNIKGVKLVTWGNLEFLWGNIEANIKLKRCSNDVEGQT